jgi:hypothetical protein
LPRDLVVSSMALVVRCRLKIFGKGIHSNRDGRERTSCGRFRQPQLSRGADQLGMT